MNGRRYQRAIARRCSTLQRHSENRVDAAGSSKEESRVPLLSEGPSTTPSPRMATSPTVTVHESWTREMSVEEANLFQQSLGDTTDPSRGADEPQRHDMSIGHILNDVESDSGTDVSYAPSSAGYSQASSGDGLDYEDEWNQGWVMADPYEQS